MHEYSEKARCCSLPSQAENSNLNKNGKKVQHQQLSLQRKAAAAATALVFMNKPEEYD
jgi:hypothetical protein